MRQKSWIKKNGAVMTVAEISDYLSTFPADAQIVICCDGEMLEISDLDMDDDGIIHINS